MSVAKLVDLLANRWLYCAPMPSLDDRFEGMYPASWPEHPHKALLDQVFREQTRINCWHEETVESDALWRIYGSKDEVVAVRTEAGSLRDAVDAVPDLIAISRVHYIDYDTYDQPPGVPFYPFVYKRDCFRHEAEVRVIIQPPVAPGDLLSGNPPPPLGAFLLPIRAEEVIHGVIVSPYAQEWFLASIRALTSALGLRCPVEFSSLR